MKVNELYSSIAHEYEELINSPQVKAKLLDEVIKIFDKYKITEGSILDVGCGPGNLKKVLGENFSFTGIDVAEKMLEIAKDRGYTTIKGKMEEEVVKIPTKSFDYVVSVSSLYFVEDAGFMISEFERIARKGLIATLADLTENYIEKFPVEETLYNHTKLSITGVSEDVWSEPWVSIKTGDEIRERVVFKRL